MKSQQGALARERSLQLLNVQETLNGVLRQLERLERAHDDVKRVNPMKRDARADRNQATVEDNLKALNTKLGCLQGILEEYSSEAWAKAECVRHISNWYMERRGQYSSCMLQAVIDCLEACYGEYQMKETPPVALTEEKLNDFAAKLYEACEAYHRKEEKLLENPQAYAQKKQLYKVDMKRKGDVETMYKVLEDLRSELTRAKQLPVILGERKESMSQSSNPTLTVHATGTENQCPTTKIAILDGETIEETTRLPLITTNIGTPRSRNSGADFTTHAKYLETLNENLDQENVGVCCGCWSFVNRGWNSVKRLFT